MAVHTSIVRFAAIAALALGALVARPAMAAPDCAQLARLALPDGEVTSAELVKAGAFTPPAAPGGPPPGVAPASFADLPAFCRIRATRRPSADSDIKVEVWLPATGWNGKFVGIGNGVWAGTISYVQMGQPLTRGYAVGATDTGHVGNGMSGEFAVGHPEKLIDFGYRAVHEMVVTAKQAIGAFYGRQPEYSLWDSCSTGGRQGLMEAHRYPADFDAISAMAPANPMTALMTQTMWAGWQPQRFEADGGRLTPAHLALVHQAVLAKCDTADGVTDQVVGRPLQCAFSPASLECQAGARDNCLSPGQAQAMQALYDGVRAEDGAQLLPGWPRGSEMQLAVLIGGDEPFPVATSYFRQLAFADQPNWNWKGMDYRRDLAAARKFGGEMLDVPADGLSAFFARGGKLLLGHGWTDGLIPATNTLAFHAALLAALAPGEAEAQLRLYMVPGMDHCAGGAGATQFDVLGVIDNWVTSGTPPETINAIRGASPLPPAPPPAPLSRPLCAWPMVERYSGSGDNADASSFSCGPP